MPGKLPRADRARQPDNAIRTLLGAALPKCAAMIEQLRAACLVHLRTRVAEPLALPADWRRASTLPCRCALCAELARFLAAPERETWSLKAAEADRSHVEQIIKRAGSNVDVATDRRGRPYTLVCTKNQASYERRARQRRPDLKNLELLTS